MSRNTRMLSWCRVSVGNILANCPLQLYDAILDSTFSSDPTSADYHYAYQVLAYVDPDSVRESWADYL